MVESRKGRFSRHRRPPGATSSARTEFEPARGLPSIVRANYGRQLLNRRVVRSRHVVPRAKKPRSYQQVVPITRCAFPATNASHWERPNLESVLVGWPSILATLLLWQ